MVKMLVLGDASASSAFLVKKLTALISKSGPFAFALLLHPPSSLIPPPQPFPLPTFFASQHPPSTPSPNLQNLGPASALTHSSLTIFLLASDYDDPPSATTPLPPEISAAILQAGASGAGFRGTDILISPTPPRGLALAPTSALVARVAAALRPRYHFCSGEAYLEAAPFVVPGAVHATRMIALAWGKSGKKKTKEKWLYAADVQPVAGMSVEALAATRAGIVVTCPYDDGGRKRAPEVLGSVGRAVKKPYKARKIETPSDAKCWFCLASGKDPHLVVGVGEHFYVAAAKGGLVPEHVLIVPVGHIRHSLDGKMNNAMRAEVAQWKECVRKWFREGLGCGVYFFERAVATRGGSEQMHMHINCVPMKAGTPGAEQTTVNKIATEWGMHGVETVEEGVECLSLLRDLCERECRAEGSGVTPETFEFFWAEFPDGSRTVHNISGAAPTTPRAPQLHQAVAAKDRGESEENGLVEVADRSSPTTPALDGRAPSFGQAGKKTPVESSENRKLDSPDGNDKLQQGGKARHRTRHPLQFGRRIATEILNMPSRVDWKTCVGALREERRAASRVREEFAPFQPAASDDEENS